MYLDNDSDKEINLSINSKLEKNEKEEEKLDEPENSSYIY